MSCVFCSYLFSVSLQWCGRTHRTSLYCCFTLRTRMQCGFTKNVLTQMGFFCCCCRFSFPCIKNPQKFALANFSKKYFLTYKWRGREKVFPWFFFCNFEVANAEVVLPERLLWILALLLGFFFHFLAMGMEKPASIQVTLTSFCDLTARPFLTWDWVWVKVGSHVNLGFSQPLTAVEKLLHESFLFHLLRGWEGGVTILPYQKTETSESRTRPLETVTQITSDNWKLSIYFKILQFSLSGQ